MNASVPALTLQPRSSNSLDNRLWFSFEYDTHHHHYAEKNTDRPESPVTETPKANIAFCGAGNICVEESFTSGGA